MRRSIAGVAFGLVICATLGAACGSKDGAAPGGSADASVVEGGAVGDGAGPTGDGGIHVAEAAPPFDAGSIDASQPLTPYIVVDQFGYRTGAEKIAVIRNPKTGFDVGTAFTPGAKYALVDAHDGTTALEAAPAAWNGGATDMSSGDQAWWFDFSSVQAPGAYYVLDESQGVRSPIFSVTDNVYVPVMKQAMRMYYYQRSGMAHDAKYAGAGWADGVNDAQDATCTLCPGCPGTGPTRDVHGGWFDAGDQNRYSTWASTDVIQLLRAYVQNPTAFTDDYDIPESGNGTPDLLDEVKWELDWLLRMQNSDGSVQSIAAHQGASPPSTDASPCYYGSVNTSSAYSVAAVFAFASTVYKTVDDTYANQLLAGAKSAWTWAQANPNVTFHNTSYSLGGGDSELDTYTAQMRPVEAAAYLFLATSDKTYSAYVDANYKNAHLLGYGNYADMFDADNDEMLLDYAKTAGATEATVSAIQSNFLQGMMGANNLGSQTPAATDPYGGAMYTYTWGSNEDKATQGNLFQDIFTYAVAPSMNADAAKYAERYVHPFHGVNPLQMVYLSNMGDYGATKSVTRFFHTWFNNTSTLWNAVGVSTYGPPPGYLPGGPNPSYTWDGCCPNGCSGNSCGAAQLSPPANQPSQKAYLDFNGNWPLDSWSVTEPDLGYQAAYVRLLSNFMQ